MASRLQSLRPEYRGAELGSLGAHEHGTLSQTNRKEQAGRLSHHRFIRIAVADHFAGCTHSRQDTDAKDTEDRLWLRLRFVRNTAWHGGSTPRQRAMGRHCLGPPQSVSWHSVSHLAGCSCSLSKLRMRVYVSRCRLFIGSETTT